MRPSRRGERVGGVGDDDLVGEAGAAQLGGLDLVADDGDDLRGVGVPGGGERERAGLPGGAEDGDCGGGVGAAGDDASDERGGAAHVEDGEREVLGQVVGEDGGDGAAEEDRVAAGRNLLGVAVPARQTVINVQRREGEGDEGGDLLAGFEAERGAGADGVDGADEHAAGAGDGVVHLAAALDDGEHFGPDRLAVAAVGGVELPVGGRVEVEALDADADLVVGDLGVGVEPVGRLWQRSGGADDSVRSDR